jgi:hypothetical protein
MEEMWQSKLTLKNKKFGMADVHTNCRQFNEETLERQQNMSVL